MPGMRHSNWTVDQQAPWIKDFLTRDHLVPGGALLDPTLFYATDSVAVTVAAGVVAVGATSITVTALTGEIPEGAVLSFGSGKFARVAATASAGATTITIDPLPVALAGGETETYAGDGVIIVPQGTPVGRTLAERDAGAHLGPAVDTDDEFYLVVHTVVDVLRNRGVTLYRPGSLVAENYLPNWTNAAIWTAGMKTKLRATYRCIRGGE